MASFTDYIMFYMPVRIILEPNFTIHNCIREEIKGMLATV
jgi:hypothetical protein